MQPNGAPATWSLIASGVSQTHCNSEGVNGPGPKDTLSPVFHRTRGTLPWQRRVSGRDRALSGVVPLDSYLSTRGGSSRDLTPIRRSACSPATHHARPEQRQGSQRCVWRTRVLRSEEHTSELQSLRHLV